MVTAHERRQIANFLSRLFRFLTFATTTSSSNTHHVVNQEFPVQRSYAKCLCRSSGRPISYQPLGGVLLQREHGSQQRSRYVHLDNLGNGTLSMLTWIVRLQYLPVAWRLQRQMPGQILLRRPAIPGVLVLEREADQASQRRQLQPRLPRLPAAAVWQQGCRSVCVRAS